MNTVRTETIWYIAGYYSFKLIVLVSRQN